MNECESNLTMCEATDICEDSEGNYTCLPNTTTLLTNTTTTSLANATTEDATSLANATTEDATPLANVTIEDATPLANATTDLYIVPVSDGESEVGLRVFLVPTAVCLSIVLLLILTAVAGIILTR